VTPCLPETKKKGEIGVTFLEYPSAGVLGEVKKNLISSYGPEGKTGAGRTLRRDKGRDGGYVLPARPTTKKRNGTPLHGGRVGHYHWVGGGRDPDRGFSLLERVEGDEPARLGRKVTMYA